MTDEEIETLALKHIAPHAGKFKAAFGLDVPYQQTEQFQRVKALAREIERRTLERAAERCMYVTGSAPGEYFSQEIRALEQK